MQADALQDRGIPNDIVTPQGMSIHQMGEMNGTIDVRLEHAQGIHVILLTITTEHCVLKTDTLKKEGSIQGHNLGYNFISLP